MGQIRYIIAQGLDSTISFSFQGGETHGGSLFIIGLNDLYEGKTEAVSIYSGSKFKMYLF